MGWFSSDKGQAHGSLPVINLAKRPKNEADAANLYLTQYLAPTKIYGGEKLQCLVPACITTLLTAAPPTSRAELTAIENYIRETKTIPSLAYVPDDLKYMTDKDIWWFVPGVVVAGPYFSWVAVSKNGLYCASPEDENDGMQLIGWDHIDAIECTYEETNCCCLHMHTAKGSLTLSELLAGDRSSSLPVVKAIHDVYKPVIEASRGTSMWKHGAGGENYRSFESPQQLLIASAWGERQEPQARAVAVTSDPAAAGTGTAIPGGFETLSQAVTYVLIVLSAVGRDRVIGDVDIIRDALRLVCGPGASISCDSDISLANERFNENVESDTWHDVAVDLESWIRENCSLEQRRTIHEHVLKFNSKDTPVEDVWHIFLAQMVDLLGLLSSAPGDETHLNATGKQSADADDASGGEADDEEASETIPALNWTPVTLNSETDPPYPGRYFFVPPPLASKMMRLKLVSVRSRAYSLAPDPRA